nr:helix-turn-helix domain-containing protein [Brachybacterium sp. YJGR34]
MCTALRPLEHVQDVLSISRSQAYALVRSGDLRASRVGGGGQWRVELTELEGCIERGYQAAAAALSDEDSDWSPISSRPCPPTTGSASPSPTSCALM